MATALHIGLVVAISGTGLFGSNILYDRGVPNPVARALTGMIGGVAFLLALLLLDTWVAVALSVSMALAITWIRLKRKSHLRGVLGDNERDNWGEVTFVVAGAFSLAIGGGVFGSQWLAFLPIAFMAWGDNTVGITRATIWRTYESRYMPTLAMFGIGLLLAVMAEPFWIGATGAAVATLAERYRVIAGAPWDDNIAIVVVSLIVMGSLALVTGNV